MVGLSARAGAARLGPAIARTKRACRAYALMVGLAKMRDAGSRPVRLVAAKSAIATLDAAIIARRGPRWATAPAT